MKLKYKKQWIMVYMISIICFVFYIVTTYINLKSKYVVSGADTFFHAQRIFEVKDAISNGALPSWSNFLTFHHVGQPINGMYPDISLWPLVLVTNFLDPVQQIICIRMIIGILTYVVTFKTLSKRYDIVSSAFAAGIYCTSGIVLKSYYFELQVGVAITCIFLVPIVINFKDLVCSTHIDRRLVVKTAILSTVVIYSHLMSIFVLYLVVCISLVIVMMTNWRKYKAYGALNLLLSSMILLLTSLPILYRYCIISASHLHPAFSYKNVEAIKFIDLFVQATWDSREYLSIVSIILLMVFVLGLNKKKINILIPYICIELLLIVLGSDLAPWNLLEKMPILSSIQNTGWRFIVFTGIVPLLLILINYSKRVSRLILGWTFVVSILVACNLWIGFYRSTSENLVPLTNKESRTLSINDWVKLQSSGINSDKITRNIVPDYGPNNITVAPNTNGANLSADIQKVILNNQLRAGHKEIPAKLKYTYKSVSFKLLERRNYHSIVLPVYGYKSLNYTVKVNNKKKNYKIGKNGFIKISNAKEIRSISVEYTYPRNYLYIVAFSLSLLILLSIDIYFHDRKVIRNGSRIYN